MITRKTRFISGLAAIFMLISMFTAFVLPVSADEALYPYVRDMETLGRGYVNDWGISSAEDWKAAVRISQGGETFTGLTLHFTADIDFDVDGSGIVEEDEYIDTLGVEFGFAGSIHGHGHVIKNLYIDHNITTEGLYAGLIGRGTGADAVIRDLGLASGKVNIHGTGSSSVYTGAFMGRHDGPVTYANCWSDVEVYADAQATEIDMAPFGRLGSGTLVNCYNAGDLTARNGAGKTRVDGLYDWSATIKIYVSNCFNVGTLTGTTSDARYLFSFGSWADSTAEYERLFNQASNIYACGINTVSNKPGLDTLLADVMIDKSIYSNGELAGLLNDNYDPTYDSLYGRKYYMIKDGKTVFTDDRYEALYALTIFKKSGDYVVESETKYYNAATYIELPVFEGYELTSYTESIFPLDDGTFRMPAENAELVYTANVPNWGLIEEMIAKYQTYKTSGQYKIMVNGAGILELLEKLEMTYAAKDTMDNATALKRIMLYVEQDRNLDLNLKEDLTYPDYPLLRNINIFGKDASKNWAISSAEDWLYAIELSKGGETFSGMTLHFTDDIDFEKENMEPLCATVDFAGNIDGHGHVIKNMKIEVASKDTATKYVGLIGRATGSSVVKVIKNLGIASGAVTAYSVDDNEAFTGAFMGHSCNTYFINCWNAANVTVKNAEGSAQGKGVPSMVGRVGDGTEGALINCFNLGNITEDTSNGSRAAALAEWIKGPYNVINCFNAGTISSSYVSTGLNYNNATHYGNAVIKNFYSVGSSKLITTGSTLSVPDNIDSVGKVLEEEAIASGELAWLMNNGYVDPTPYLPAGETAPERPYYVVKDGMIAIGTADEQPIKVAVVSAENTSYYYILLNKQVDLNGDYIVGAPTYTLENPALGTITNGILTLTTAPADGVAVVNVSFRGGLDYVALNSVIASFDEEVGLDNYISGVSNKRLSDLLAEIKVKNYETQGAIDADVELLSSYAYTISISQYADYPDATGYTVASKAEMDILAGISASLTADQTIYITADIDMEGTPDKPNTCLAALKASIEGMGHAISNLYITNAWLGDYKGASLRNLTIKDSIAATTSTTKAFLINTAKVTTEISNVTLDNVTINHGATSVGIYGLMIACLDDGGDLTLKDIAIVNSTFNRNDLAAGSSSTYCNSGIVLGKTYDGKLTVDGVYLNNNTITGKRTGNGTGVAFGEIICTATIKNVGIFNTTADDASQRGVLASMIKENTTYEVQPKIVIENVIALNNGETVNLIGTDEANKCPFTVKNVYTDTTKIASEDMDTLAVTNGVASAADSITSGEAAHKINAAGTDKTWAMVNGVPAPAEEGLPVKVSFVSLAGEELIALYTDAEGKLIGLTESVFNAVSAWEGYENIDALAAEIFTADAEIKEVECNHNITVTPNGDGTHTTTCSTVGGCGKNEIENCTYTYTLSTDGVNHVKTCADCGYTDEVACVFTSQYVPHTSEAKGYTKYDCECGYNYTVEDAELLHDFSGVGTVVKKPTYATVDSDGKGMSETKCATCDAIKYDEIPALTLEEGTAGIVVKANESATAGDTVEVTLEIANNPGIAGINMGVTYDPEVLTLEGIANGGLFAQFVGPKGGVENVNGFISLTFLNTTNLLAADTDGKALVTLTFVVNEDADIGSSDIAVELIKGKDEMDTENTGAVNENGKYVTVKGSSTMVEIVDYLWGDADGDGVTGIPDALMILQWKVGLVEDSALNMEAADADCDGTVGIPDALMILQWKVGLVEWDPNGGTVEPAIA